MRSVAQNLGVGTTETVRKWVRRPHSLPLSGRSDERALARIGATLVRDKGEHTIYRCTCGQHQTALPRHTDITAGVVGSIIKQLPCAPKGWLQ
jgi:predicted RNA binding protein YcfA (HicA-like mRNA interferase family)